MRVPPLAHGASGTLVGGDGVTMPALGRQEPAVLSRELADFLIEFSITLHKNAIYPPGHPLLDQAVTGLERRSEVLLTEQRNALSIGVARRQLIIEGVATDPNHPLLRELAQRLHRHHIGAVRFTRGLENEELRSFLTTLAVDASRMELPLGLGDPDVLQQWPHARLFPLSFEQLELLDEDDDEMEMGDGKDKRRARAATLWIGLARAAMASEGDELKSTDPVVVAKAINEHGKDVAYDQVVVGYLLQIAEELKSRKGKEAIALQKRISRLVEQLQPDTLERLMDMGGDVTQRNKFVLHAAAGMTVDAVVDIVRAAASTSAQGISQSMIRMLTKFATHADTGEPELRPQMDSALREHVQRLIGEWTLDDPNPEAYGQALEGMARADPLYQGVDRYPCEPRRMIAMALEVGSVGDAVWRAVDEMAATQGLGDLLGLVDDAPEGWARDAVLDRVATTERLAEVLPRQNADDVIVTALAGHLGLAAVEPLIDALERADDRSAAAIVELLTPYASAAGPALLQRLPMVRWSAQRLFLLALSRLPQRPAAFVPTDWATHPDPAVRREALKMMLKEGTLREEGVQLGVLDSDIANVRLALSAALTDCPSSAVSAVMQRADDPVLPAELRALAVRVAAGSRAEQVVPWLATRTLGKKRLFRQRLAEKTPELLAALTGLAQHWADRPMAEQVIAIAERDRDPDIRTAVTRRPTKS